MSNEQSPKATPDEKPAKESQKELGEAELEAVAGGAGDAFDGKYLATGVTHTAGGLSRVSKVEALWIKQK